jgi:hypothetical protein
MTLLPVRDTSARRPSWAYVAERLPDGSIRAKVIWRRDVGERARLTVGVQTLKGKAERLRAKVVPGPRTSRFLGSQLFFSRAGCWQVNARWGAARLDFVVRVLPAQRTGW